MLKHLKSSEEWSEKSLGAKGFTLIELLVVIVILGILAAVVVFSVRGITDKGDKSACEAQVNTIETAVEAYRAANDAYPSGQITGAHVLTGANGFLKKTPNTKWGTPSVNGTTGEVTGITCPT